MTELLNTFEHLQRALKYSLVCQTLTVYGQTVETCRIFDRLNCWTEFEKIKRLAFKSKWN